MDCSDWRRSDAENVAHLRAQIERLHADLRQAIQQEALTRDELERGGHVVGRAGQARADAQVDGER